MTTPPPLRLKGWGKVVEIGVKSASGTLLLPNDPETGESDLGHDVPNLAVRGHEGYRLRIHAREADTPVEGHLVISFPGNSAKAKVYK
ncbi:hypothetical protein [Spongiactinospora gelatinilytica]|nr:hypothetical protein [Spongiactinospora gelatinilytica]